MKAEDSISLRQGNIINYCERAVVCDINTIYAVSKLSGESNLYSFTPLTEDMMISLGFAYDERKWHLKEGWRWIRVSLMGKNSASFEINGSQILIIDYVHELQNLVHSLTGTELTLNQ